MRSFHGGRYFIFIIITSLMLNTAIFIMEWIKPTSAEHWHAGTAMLIIALVTLIWKRNSDKEKEIMNYTFKVLVINGIWAIVLDIIYYLVKGVV